MSYTFDYDNAIGGVNLLNNSGKRVLKDLMCVHQVNGGPDLGEIHMDRTHSLTDSVMTTIFTKVRETKPNTQIVFIHVNISSSAIQETVQLLREWQDTYGYEILELMSTGLARPRTLTKVLKKDDTYYAFISSIDVAHFYQIFASILMMINKDNGPFVRKLAEAVTKNRVYEMSPEEKTLVQEYKNKHLQEVAYRRLDTALSETLLKPKDYLEEIDNLRDIITDVERNLIQKQNMLKDLLIRQFYIEHNGNAVNEEDLQYFRTYANRIVSIGYGSEGGNTYITVISPLTFSENPDNWYMRMEDNGEFPEYILKVLKGVIEGTVRLYMGATIYLERNSGHGIQINGTRMSTNNAQFLELPVQQHSVIPNRHITEYNCFSDAKINMLKHLNNDDPIGFFETLLYTIGSVNCYDGIVMSGIVSDIKSLTFDDDIEYYNPEEGVWKHITIGGYNAL